MLDFGRYFWSLFAVIFLAAILTSKMIGVSQEVILQKVNKTADNVSTTTSSTKMMEPEVNKTNLNKDEFLDGNSVVKERDGSKDYGDIKGKVIDWSENHFWVIILIVVVVILCFGAMCLCLLMKGCK